MSETSLRPPRDDLLRAVPGQFALRADDERSILGVLTGQMLVFNEWAEIDSVYEGHFLERIAPGAAAKTIAETGSRMRVLFNHGQDPSIGNKVLGRPALLEERATHVHYEVPLLDTSYNRDLEPGLREGLYGSSFRFFVVRDEYVERPRKSAHNPDGLPERTLIEIGIREFGPVTWPAYSGATAGMRSVTDTFLLERLAEELEPEQLEEVVTRHSPHARDEERARENTYERTFEYVSEAAWAITPRALATVLAILSERRSGYRPSDDEIAERIGGRPVDEDLDDLVEELDLEEPEESPVAVIPIMGPILPRVGGIQKVSGLTSVIDMREQFRQAVADPKVKAIVLNIDSPGGAVDLVPEFGAEILAARGAKPIVAVANTMAASAAYWLASAADELVVSPSGEVGSIGVYSAHEDWSKHDKDLGVTTTLIHAGEFKVERNPFEPLGEEAAAEMQRKVDAYYAMFVAAVAAGRGVDAATVIEKFGQGRMSMALDAVEAGMADRVETLDETIARLEAQIAAKAAREAAASAIADATEASEPEDVDVDESWPADEADTPVNEPEAHEDAPIGDPEPEPSEATTQTKPEPELSAAATHERPLYGTKEKPSWQL